MVQVVQVTSRRWFRVQKEMAGHTGQSSQLFPFATGRNAQFLATVASNALVQQVNLEPCKRRGKINFCPYKRDGFILQSVNGTLRGTLNRLKNARCVSVK